MKNAFKDRLRQAMHAKNLKAVDVCNQTNIPKSAMSYYLSGRSEPKADRLYLLSKVLDVSEAWLLGYDVGIERTKAQKNNDTIASIVVKLKTDDDFLSLVDDLLNNVEFLSAVQSIRSLANKKLDVPDK